MKRMTTPKDGWQQHREMQTRGWLQLTPAKRLAALERMIEFVRWVDQNRQPRASKNARASSGTSAEGSTKRPAAADSNAAST